MAEVILLSDHEAALKALTRMLDHAEQECEQLREALERVQIERVESGRDK